MLEKLLKQLAHATGHPWTKAEFASAIKEALKENKPVKPAENLDKKKPAEDTKE